MAPRIPRVRTRTSPMSTYDKLCLRQSILEEDRLRRSVADDEEEQRADPDRWQRRESERLARNSEMDVTNQRLRDLDLPAMPLELSLAQRRRKLHVLEARNAAETARLRGEPIESGQNPRGTALASVRRRQ